eukprot:3554896-Amphidinium_carterae.1
MQQRKHDVIYPVSNHATAIKSFIGSSDEGVSGAWHFDMHWADMHNAVGITRHAAMCCVFRAICCVARHTRGHGTTSRQRRNTTAPMLLA